MAKVIKVTDLQTKQKQTDTKSSTTLSTPKVIRMKKESESVVEEKKETFFEKLMHSFHKTENVHNEEVKENKISAHHTKSNDITLSEENMNILVGLIVEKLSQDFVTKKEVKSMIDQGIKNLILKK